MKKILIFVLISVLLLSSCSCASNNNIVKDLNSGTKKADALLKIGAGNYVDAEQYVFFKDTDGKSVVMYFDGDNLLSRVESYETPANEPTANAQLDLPIGTDIYEVIRYLGAPVAFSHGSYYQLTFDYPSSRIITTWEKTDTDKMVLRFRPYFIDYSETETET